MDFVWRMNIILLYMMLMGLLEVGSGVLRQNDL